MLGLMTREAITQDQPNEHAMLIQMMPRIKHALQKRKTNSMLIGCVPNTARIEWMIQEKGVHRKKQDQKPPYMIQ